MSLMTVLLVLLVLAFVFGGYGQWGPRPWGHPYGWSPAALIAAVLVVLLLTGRIR